MAVYGMTRAELVEILSALQYDDSLAFRQSLATLRLSTCGANEEDLGRLLFEILPRFRTLHTIDIPKSSVESLRGIEDRIIKQLGQMTSPSPSPLSSLQTAIIPDNRLQKLSLSVNPVMKKISADDPKEKRPC